MITIHWLWIFFGVVAVFMLYLLSLIMENAGGDYDFASGILLLVWLVGCVAIVAIFGGILLW